jgi:hypothetical protein
MNGGNFAQHLTLGNWGVVLGQGIAARDPLRVVLLDQTMNEEPVVTRDQHDVAGNGLFASFVLDAQNIAGPDRRQHARSQSLQAYAATRLEDFGCEIEFVILANLGREHGRWIYEVFRLKRH